MLAAKLFEIIKNGENSGVEFKRDDIRPEQLANLRGGILHPELLPVAGATLKALDRVRLRNYLEEILHDPEVPDSEAEWLKRLTGMGFMADAPVTGPVCTIAGLVLFGFSPRRYLRQAGIRVMAFDGADKTDRALLDEVLDGPLVARWRIDESGSRTVADTGIIERLLDNLRPFITQEQDIVEEWMRRTKNWLYPRDAVRETVINALAHRDWTRSIDVEVVNYSDRLEVISPGALPNSMTVEKMIAGRRSPRNPLIVEVLRDYGYVDARGMGVRTKIIPLMRRENRKEPVFDAAEDYLRTVLPRAE